MPTHNIYTSSPEPDPAPDWTIPDVLRAIMDDECTPVPFLYDMCKLSNMTPQQHCKSTPALSMHIS